MFKQVAIYMDQERFQPTTRALVCQTCRRSHNHYVYIEGKAPIHFPSFGTNQIVRMVATELDALREEAWPLRNC